MKDPSIKVSEVSRILDDAFTEAEINRQHRQAKRLQMHGDRVRFVCSALMVCTIAVCFSIASVAHTVHIIQQLQECPDD